MRSIIGIVPARIGSSRLSQKMLAPLQGKPLLQWTLENARRFENFSRLIVATDDQRIFDLARSADCEALLTPESCQSGTERAAHCIHCIQGVPDDAVVINIQGDWPLLKQETIGAVAQLLLADESLRMASAVVPLHDAESLHNPSVVKCVLDNFGRALYFSRSPIPYPRDVEPAGPLPALPQFYGHLGIYGYRSDFLARYPSLPASPLATIERLEQLKALESGHPIQMAVVEDLPFGIDTADDLTKLEEQLCSPSTRLQSTSSSPAAS